MGQFKRIVADEDSYWESKIEQAALLLGKVRNKYSRGRFAPGVLLRQNVHKRTKSKEYRVLKSVIEALERLRADNVNPWQAVLEDYLICVHEFYAQRHRVPFTTQLVVTELTLSLFLEWVSRWEDDKEQPYWFDKIMSPEEVNDRAIRSLVAAREAKHKLLQAARSGRFEKSLSEDIVTEFSANG